METVKFSIEGISRPVGVADLTVAQVSIAFTDRVEDVDHLVRIEVRPKIHDSATIRDMNEAIFAKAKEVLAHALHSLQSAPLSALQKAEADRIAAEIEEATRQISLT